MFFANRKSKLLSLLTIVSLFFTFLVGCGAQEATKDDSEGKPASQENIEIAVVVKALNSDFWKTVEAGAKDAGKDLGIHVDVLGPSAETAVVEQVSMIEDQITRGVSALAVAPSQPSSAIPAFELAKSSDIPIILIDTDAEWPDKVSFVGTGNYEGGKLAGEFLADKLGKGAKILILRGAMGDPIHDERTEGAVAALEEGGLEIVDIQPANSERGLGMSVMENMLEAHQEIDGVFATNDEMILGAIRAIKASGKDMCTVGFDAAPDAMKSIAEGELTASIAQNAYNIGYVGVETALKAIKGEKVEKRIDTGTFIVSEENVKDEQEKIQKILGN